VGPGEKGSAVEVVEKKGGDHLKLKLPRGPETGTKIKVVYGGEPKMGRKNTSDHQSFVCCEVGKRAFRKQTLGARHPNQPLHKDRESKRPQVIVGSGASLQETSKARRG